MKLTVCSDNQIIIEVSKIDNEWNIVLPEINKEDTTLLKCQEEMAYRTRRSIALGYLTDYEDYDRGRLKGMRKYKSDHPEFLMRLGGRWGFLGQVYYDQDSYTKIEDDAGIIKYVNFDKVAMKYVLVDEIMKEVKK